MIILYTIHYFQNWSTLVYMCSLEIKNSMKLLIFLFIPLLKVPVDEFFKNQELDLWTTTFWLHNKSKERGHLLSLGIYGTKQVW